MRQCILCNEEQTLSYSFSNVFKIKENWLCQSCMGQLDKVNEGCMYCLRKGIEGICEDCLFWMSYEKTKMFIIKNHALYYYNELSKRIINQVKFNGDCRLLIAFQNEILKYFKKHFRRENMILIPVPLHKERLRERGFNQSEVLCQKLPYKVLHILDRNQNDTQSKKVKQDRFKFNDNFSISQDVDLKGMQVMIIDDIYTTGATIHKIGCLLYDKGARDIQSFTLFRS